MVGWQVVGGREKLTVWRGLVPVLADPGHLPPATDQLHSKFDLRAELDDPIGRNAEEFGG